MCAGGQPSAAAAAAAAAGAAGAAAVQRAPHQGHQLAPLSTCTSASRSRQAPHGLCPLWQQCPVRHTRAHAGAWCAGGTSRCLSTRCLPGSGPTGSVPQHRRPGAQPPTHSNKNLQPTQTTHMSTVLVVTSHPCVCRCSIGVTELDLLATNGAGLAAKAAEAEAAKAAGAGAAGAAALGDQGVVGQGSPSAQMTMDWLVHDLKQPRSLTLGQGVCWAESSVLERIQKCGRLLCEW